MNRSSVVQESSTDGCGSTDKTMQRYLTPPADAPKMVDSEEAGSEESEVCRKKTPGTEGREGQELSLKNHGCKCSGRARVARASNQNTNPWLAPITLASTFMWVLSYTEWCIPQRGQSDTANASLSYKPKQGMTLSGKPPSVTRISLSRS